LFKNEQKEKLAKENSKIKIKNGHCTPWELNILKSWIGKIIHVAMLHLQKL